MAGWFTVFKAIPWTRVVAAAPDIVDSAKVLMRRGAASRTQGERIETRLAELEARQEASAELIRSLAEQNAELVRALDALRVRARTLLALALAAGVLAVAALAWLSLR